MHCENCGREITAGSVFCSKCGSSQIMEKSAVYCNKCGCKIAINAKFCKSCGNQMPSSQSIELTATAEPISIKKGTKPKKKVTASIVALIAGTVITVAVIVVVFTRWADIYDTIDSITRNNMGTLGSISQNNLSHYTDQVGQSPDDYLFDSQLTSDDSPNNDAITTSNEYILPFSSSRSLTDDDLRHLTRVELRLARNEIYARYGRVFRDADLQGYFDSKSWYANIRKLPLGEDPTISALEFANIELIQSYESR